MNAVANLEKPTRLEAFRLEVLPPERKADLFSSLPSHVRPERFERNLVNALMANPDLMNQDPRLVFREVSKAAALGLYLDPQLGEAYLILAWNGKAKRLEPQLRIGYRGLVKLGRQSGEISMIYAHEVHENDLFECVLGDQKSLVHKPDVFGDRGALVGYYAVVKYRDGETDFEPMTVAQVHAIRDRSDAWKAFKDGKIKSTPWATDDGEMSKKTVIRRLVKRIPQSPELAEAIKIEDAAEHGELRASAPAARLVPPSPAQMITPPAPPSPDQPAVADDERAAKPATPQAPHRADQSQSDPSAWIADCEQRMAECADLETLRELWECVIAPESEDAFPGDVAEVRAAFDRHEARLAG
ncbi:recombinase RecT [Hansschlegelia sp.]|uniref:recombinase RecT n=1 Tax=Hansschlegelia sp. TaxID=2041892 RepID=UPI002C081BF5|nr:recombinase RecT [Hansschlegelia sp.]HVI27486.1 recombinase RecT [Hansschlegelia sp.]